MHSGHSDGIDTRGWTHCFSDQQIKRLSKLDTKELVKKIDNQLKAFQVTLGKPNRSVRLAQPATMEAVIEILSKLATEAQSHAYGSELQGTAGKVLAEVLSDRCTHFHSQLRLYINTRGSQTRGAIQPLCELFQILLTTLPQSSWSCLPIDELRDALKGMGQVSSTLVSKIEQLVQHRDQIRQAHMVQKKAKQTIHVLDEWDNSEYRSIQILPIPEEVCMNVLPKQLRPNIVRGCYDDWMHYYDVQFRLLREDFIAPLRRGITDYQQGLRGRNLRDVKVYDDVTIIDPVCTRNGICFKLHFDAKRFRCKWEHTKRLLFGSLMCLSCDNFQNVIVFATIADREPRKLYHGEVTVQFEDSISVLPYCQKKTSFVMVESSAYFQASCHILISLQKAEVDTMPFTKYLIKGECSSVAAPKYLEGSKAPVYDLSCLYGTAKCKRKLEINILNGDEWPTEESDENIELDTSQLQAIRMGLTQEVSVIQGPPGTGKTYIGLKIVEALLSNKHVWDPDEVSPILVVCYTNHALDQFLEGILQQGGRESYEGYPLRHPELIRIGGRCQSEKVDEFNIRNVYKQYAPHNIRERLWHLGKKLGRPIPEACWLKVKNYFNPNHAKLLLLQDLQTFIDPEHFYQLSQIAPSKELEGKQLEIWLGLWEQEGKQSHQTKNEQLSAHQLTTSHGHRMQPPSYHLDSPAHDSVSSSDDDSESDQEGPPPLESTAQESDKEDSDTDDKEEELVEVEAEAAVEEAARMLDEDAEDYKPIKYDEALDEELLSDKYLERNKDENQEEKAEDGERENGVKTTEKSVNDRMNQVAEAAADETEDETSDCEEDSDHDRGEEIRDKPTVAEMRSPKPKPKWKRRANAYHIIRTNIFRSFMSEQKAAQVEDIMQLSLSQRWRLYNYWTRKHYEALQGQNVATFQKYNELCQEYKETRQQANQYALERADVIGMTTTGAAQYQHILHLVKPKIVIVEEAAEVLESHIVSTLNAGTQHLILIGDHKQLRPKPNEYKLAKEFKLEVSLFERLMCNHMPHATLRIQHRMRPEIARLVHPHIYDTLINHSSVEQYKSVKGVSKNMFFVQHEFPETGDANLLSHANEHEANFIVALCRYFLQQGYDPTQITILTPYTGQLLKIKNRMPRIEFGGVRVTAVDNFQGEENDIILLSLVRSNEEDNIGFLKEDNRVCVSLSRAKVGFYCIGNFRMLRRRSNLWERIMSDMESKGYVGDSLPLECYNHPEMKFAAKDPPDFAKNAPNGGCLKPCQYRLPCGHSCVGTCHPTHDRYECKKPCERKCEEGHEYPSHLCHTECPLCKVVVERAMPDCGHMQKMRCHEHPDEVHCMSPCGKSCDKGHPCKKRCYKDCNPRCMELVERVIPICGHMQKMQCHEHPYQVHCMSPCGKSCDKGHPCKKHCYQDCNPRCMELVEKVIPKCGHQMHIPCHQNPNLVKCLLRSVKEITRCGHKHIMPCHMHPSEFQCRLPCEKTCINDHPCKKFCCEPCGSCHITIEKILPLCGHNMTMPCNEDPKMVTCTAPCPKPLPCGHKCPKICGESCSIQCSATVEVRLPCGHKRETQCWKKSTYQYRRLQRITECKQCCEKQLPCGHRCMEQCGKPCTSKCLEKVQKAWPCGHILTRKCYEAQCPTSYICPKKCRKTLPCGHKCQWKCGENCICKVKVDREYPCGHTVVGVACSSTPFTAPCQEKCTYTLSCGHCCSGNCGECYATHLHKPCEFDVKVQRFCGHTVSLPCKGLSDSCSMGLTITCATNHENSSCKCLEDPTPCSSPCDWACPHFQCSKRCHEICDRPPCNEQCEEILRCGHRCASVCGEPCLQLCPECKTKEFKKQLQMTTKKQKKRGLAKNQLYIQLECKHIFTVQFLDQYMGQKLMSDIPVAPKQCPSCHTNIRATYRYGNHMKRCLVDIKNVQEIVIRMSQIPDDQRHQLLEQKVFGAIPHECRYFQRSLYHRSQFLPAMKAKLEAGNPVSHEERCAVHFLHNSIELRTLAAKHEIKTQSCDFLETITTKLMEYMLAKNGRCNLSHQLLHDFDREQYRVLLSIQCSIVKGFLLRQPSLMEDKLRSSAEHAVATSEHCLQRSEADPFSSVSKEGYEQQSQFLTKLYPELHCSLLPLELPPVVKGEWFKCRRGHYYCRPPRLKEYPCPDCV